MPRSAAFEGKNAMGFRFGFGLCVSVLVLSAFIWSRANASGWLVPDDFKSRVVDRTNSYRAQHSCPALVVNNKLNTAAQGHSDDMAYNDFFSHTGSNGSTPAQRLKAVGYEYWSAAENIAAGYTSPESVVDAWYNETPPNDGHRKNILDCSFLEIGVGYTYLANDTGDTNYNHYWVQDFGEPKNGVSATATPTRSPTATRTRTPTRTPTTTPIPTATPVICNSKPSPPTLLAPDANAQMNLANVPLDWNDVACVKKYRVLVKRDATNGPVADKKGGLQVSQHTTKTLTTGTYYWRVRACNAIGCKPSEWRMFSVQ